MCHSSHTTAVRWLRWQQAIPTLLTFFLTLLTFLKGANHEQPDRVGYVFGCLRSVKQLALFLAYFLVSSLKSATLSLWQGTPSAIALCRPARRGPAQPVPYAGSKSRRVRSSSVTCGMLPKCWRTQIPSRAWRRRRDTRRRHQSDRSWAQPKSSSTPPMRGRIRFQKSSSQHPTGCSPVLHTCRQTSPCGRQLERNFPLRSFRLPRMQLLSATLGKHSA